VPVSLQVGPLDEKLHFHGGTGAAAPQLTESVALEASAGSGSGGSGDGSDAQGGDLDSLLHFEHTLVVAQYQFLDFAGVPWPHCIPKPKHPSGTTLSLKVRGSGQFLYFPATAFVARDPAGDMPQLRRGRARRAEPAADAQVGFTDRENCAIVVPITEYHITCDRLKPHQVPGNWRNREGTCNSDNFLGECPQTLVFDTWDLDHSFVPGTTTRDRTRSRLSCCLRSRAIPINQTTPPLKYAGWNHDYHKDKWVEVRVREGNGKDAKERLRYPPREFADMFVDSGCAAALCDVDSGAWSSAGGSGSGSAAGSEGGS
jgi:hypothetical protein